jgi:hypothetical protein
VFNFLCKLQKKRFRRKKNEKLVAPDLQGLRFAVTKKFAVNILLCKSFQRMFNLEGLASYCD